MSIKNGSLETAVRKGQEQCRQEKISDVFMAVDLPGKKFPSYFCTEGEELVQITPTISGNNF